MSGQRRYVKAARRVRLAVAVVVATAGVGLLSAPAAAVDDDSGCDAAHHAQGDSGGTKWVSIDD